MSSDLNIILCSKNDSYGLNPMNRLINTLKFTSFFGKKLLKNKTFKILISDWGSLNPIENQISNHLKDNRLFKFIHTPPSDADYCNRSSPFSQPHALNQCINQSDSDFLLKIDQDTIVGPNFFQWFNESNNLPDLGYSSSRSLTKIQSKKIPKIILSDNFKDVSLIESKYSYNFNYKNKIFPFFGSRRGVLFFNKKNIKSKFNEDLIYRNYIDQNFVNTNLKKYKIFNLGLKLDFDFYHQYHNTEDTLSRKTNSFLYKKNFFEKYIF